MSVPQLKKLFGGAERTTIVCKVLDSRARSKKTSISQEFQTGCSLWQMETRRDSADYESDRGERAKERCSGKIARWKYPTNPTNAS